MATYYFRNTGDVNWGTATNWSLTDGGGATGAVPGVSDTARFTANSGNCTINISTANCGVFDTTGYSGTITMSNNIDWLATITLSSTTTLSGSGTFIIRGNGTITSNGVVVPAIRWRQSATTTLADNLTVNSFSIYTAAATTATINGNTLSTSGGLVLAGGSTCQGTTTINFIGSGTIDIPATGGSVINNPIVFNTSGTYTITILRKNSGTLTYTSGTITGSKYLYISGTTLNCAGITWNTVDPVATSTINTLTADFYCTNLRNAGASTFTFNGAFKIYTPNITLSGASTGRPIQGTSTIELNSSGTISSSGTGLLRLNTIINHSGTTTLSGTLTYGTGTLTITSGTVSGSISIIDSSTTLDFNGASISDLTISSAAATVTLNSDISILTSLVNSTSTAGSKALIKSNSTGIQRKLTLNPAATMDIGYTNFTDIDASFGRKIWVWKPTLSNTNNIYSVSYTSFRQFTNANIT